MDNKPQKINCHFISNTHWDREWRFSARRTQYMLGYMLDMLMDILEKYPEYRHFHLDSQTMPVQDYLEAYPEKRELFKKYVSEGRIGVGPWFCLPDEFTVGGESLIRNLLLGHRIGKEMGGISKTGYSPFGWGQISQLPQIYAGFDIHFASFYRGINEYCAPKSEFFWESPDGTRIYASRLGKRPRYNIWYIVQRPVFYNQQNENNRDMVWNDNNGIFKFIDSENKNLDYQYAHPFYEYHKDNIKPRAEQAIKEQDNDWTTSHRFWSLGHDSSCPDAREVEMIKDLDEALPNATVYHSSLKEMEQGIIDEFDPNSPVLKGEMRDPYTKGSVSSMMGWIISARTYIKQANFKTETQLQNYAEPMAVFAALCGAPYQKNFIDLSYNYLLQNHGHDSIGACGRDVVYEDVISRYRQSQQLSNCVYERAFMDVAGDIRLDGFSRDDAAVVVFNPAPFKRSEPVKITVEIPAEWKADSFKITDPDGEAVTYQVITTNKHSAQIIQNPNDVANVLHTQQYTIELDVKDIPAMGYKTFKLQPLYHVRATTPKTMLKRDQVMENEYLRVTFNSNGTYNVLDKENAMRDSATSRIRARSVIPGNISLPKTTKHLQLLMRTQRSLSSMRASLPYHTRSQSTGLFLREEIPMKRHVQSISIPAGLKALSPSEKAHAILRLKQRSTISPRITIFRLLSRPISSRNFPTLRDSSMLLSVRLQSLTTLSMTKSR